MKIGFFSVGIGPTAEPQLLRSVATAAERLGFATIWAPEHVVLVEQYASKYPYSSGEFPAPPDIPIAIRSPRSPMSRPAPARSASAPGFVWFPSTTRWSLPRRWRRSTG